MAKHRLAQSACWGDPRTSQRRCIDGHLRSLGQGTTAEVWSEQDFAVAESLVLENNWLLFQRIWVHSARWRNIGLYIVEAAGSASCGCELRFGNRPYRGFRHSSRFQCLAGLLFLPCDGLDHGNAPRTLFFFIKFAVIVKLAVTAIGRPSGI